MPPIRLARMLRNIRQGMLYRHSMWELMISSLLAINVSGYWVILFLKGSIPFAATMVSEAQIM